MTLIHLSERARELFFGQLVGKTLQSAKDKRCNSSKQDKLNKEALHILTKLNGGQQS